MGKDGFVLQQNPHLAAAMTSNVFPLTLIRAAGLPSSTLDPLRGDFSASFHRLQALSQHEKRLHEAAAQAMTEALATLIESPLRTLAYNLRKAHHHYRHAHANSLFSQLPADHSDFPAIARLHEAYTMWQQAVVKKDEAESDIRHAHDRLAHTSSLVLQTLAAQNDTLHRALLFSSHHLLRALPGFAQKPLAEWGKKERAIALSLTEYLSRGTWKTVPLSRWATVGVWRTNPTPGPSPTGRGDETYTEMHTATKRDGTRLVSPPSWGGAGGGADAPPPSFPKSLLTPNVALLPLLYEVLLREPAFYRSLSVALNPSYAPDTGWLYFDGERESFQQLTTNRTAQWVAETLLDAGRQMPFDELLRRLEEAVDATPDALQNLVFELIDIGLLEWQVPERGLSPSWANGLYQYLGYLPSAQVITDAAFLLQWLRTAARAIPFQTVEAAQATQVEAMEQVEAFFKKYEEVPRVVAHLAGVPQLSGPPLAVEQLFYEDVEQSVPVAVPPEAVERAVQDLAACWQQQEMHSQPPFRARLFDFARRTLAPGEAVDFLPFCRRFLEEGFSEKNATLPPVMAPRHRGKVGATLQFFQEKNGEWRAAVNGLFPGGGKLFARWLHLLPTDFREAAERWGGEAVQFGWQGWSNANFQPMLATDALALPGGKTAPKSGGSALPLTDFVVRLNEASVPQLVHHQSGKPMICTDLGLEAPDTRPPAMQVLWHLTVPYVSAEMLLPGTSGRREEAWGWRSPRTSWHSLVLQRQGWELRPDVWQSWAKASGSDADFFLQVRPTLREMQVPSRFFAHFPQLRQPPQHSDYDSPLLMRVFRKMLTLGSGPLVLTEALPLPETHATEFVVEFSVF